MAHAFAHATSSYLIGIRLAVRGNQKSDQIRTSKTAHKSPRRQQREALLTPGAARSQTWEAILAPTAERRQTCEAVVASGYKRRSECWHDSVRSTALRGTGQPNNDAFVDSVPDCDEANRPFIVCLTVEWTWWIIPLISPLDNSPVRSLSHRRTSRRASSGFR